MTIQSIVTSLSPTMVREKGKMPEPLCYDTFIKNDKTARGLTGTGYYQCIAFEDHISSLPTYLLISDKEYKVGQELEVRLQWQGKEYYTNRWKDCIELEYELFSDKNRRIVAYPVEQQQESIFKEILNNTPLETKFYVANQMMFMELLTELGYREDKSWTPDEDHILSKLCKKAKDEVVNQLEIISEHYSQQSPAVPEAINQDILWKEVEETIRLSIGLDPYRSNKIVDYLKSKYNLFTKQKI